MEEPGQLQRFIDAQQNHYAIALKEMKQGKKQSHWMWFVFPQIAGLGYSTTAQRYAISDLREATDFLKHPVLGQRLIKISQVLLDLPSTNAYEVFGAPDDLKLKSCMTLFSQVPAAGDLFQRVIDKYFRGRADSTTLNILAEQSSRS